MKRTLAIVLLVIVVWIIGEKLLAANGDTFEICDGNATMTEHMQVHEIDLTVWYTDQVNRTSRQYKFTHDEWEIKAEAHRSFTFNQYRVWNRMLVGAGSDEGILNC